MAPFLLSVFSTLAASTASTPVTLIGGFLGAGKTTAVRSMLENRRGLRIAVLVNDLASVNVDATILQRASTDDDGVATIELDNGCVCCGAGAAGLAPTVQSLQGQGFDHVVVELSGVADPANVQGVLGTAGIAAARTVALVDADAFPTDFYSVDPIMARREILAEVFENQAALPVDSAVVELLLSQVEAADLLLINKCDLASDDAVGDVVSTCKAVNAAAEVATTQFGFMDLDVLLPPLNAAAEVVPQPSTGMPPPAVSAETIGFTSFVYRASRPFSEARLSALIDSWPLEWKEVDEVFERRSSSGSGDDPQPQHPFVGVLRSKGVAWLEHLPDERLSWSHAGRHFRLEPDDSGWIEVAMGPRGMAVDGDDPPRQELVFIGTRLREEEIRTTLDACLS